MIALVVITALISATALTAVTACVVAVRGMSAPSRTAVGAPPDGIGARAVAFSSRTGHALAGWYAPGLAGHGAVLLVHGIRADRRALAGRMEVLTRAGFAVLAIDLRAHGESAGGSITFGHLEAHDVAAALAWLRSEAPGERVGALGISLEGAALALASRTSAVDAMVLESVFPDLRAAVTNRVRGVAGRAEAAFGPLLLAIGRGLTGLDPDAVRPIAAVADYRGPVLIVSGTEDRHTTIAEARALHRASGAGAEIWEVEGAGHVDMALAAGSAYERRVLDFLVRHLRGRSCA